MARDVEFVSDRCSRLGKPSPKRLVDLLLQTDQLFLQLLDPLVHRRGGILFGSLSGFRGVERLGSLRSVTINRNAFQPQLPRLHIGVGDVLHRAFIGQIHGLGYRAADERLGSGHHLEMCHVMNAAFAAERLERAVKHIQMLGLEPALSGFPVLLDVLDGVKFFHVRDDVPDFIVTVAEPVQRIRHGTVHDLQRSPAGKQLVLHQRDVRLDAGRVAVHQKRDCAGGCQHGYLRIAVAVLVAPGQRGIPAFTSGVLQVAKLVAGLNLLDRIAVQLHHAAHRLHIVLGQRLGHVDAAGILVSGKRPLGPGQLG